MAYEEVDATYSADIQQSGTLLGQNSVLFDATSGTPSTTILTGINNTFQTIGFGTVSKAPVFGAHFAQAMEWSSNTGLNFANAPQNLLILHAQQ
jgi:hypothetical protein